MKKILEEYYLKAGHASANTMKYLIGNKYKWNGMFKDIENFVRRCIICSKAGEAKRNTKNKIVESEGPNDLWEVYLIERIPDNKGSNNFIFVAIDQYCK